MSRRERCRVAAPRMRTPLKDFTWTEEDRAVLVEDQTGFDVSSEGERVDQLYAFHEGRRPKRGRQLPKKFQDFKMCGGRGRSSAALLSTTSKDKEDLPLRLWYTPEVYPCIDCHSRWFGNLCSFPEEWRLQLQGNQRSCTRDTTPATQRGEDGSHVFEDQGRREAVAEEGTPTLREESTTETHTLHHVDKSHFECPQCGKKFTQKCNLKKHLRVHTGEQPFECPQCGKKFTHKHNLKEHLYVHTGEKPFECPQCSKKFTQKSNLNKHLHIHSGEKRFECPQCGKKFKHKSYLKEHLHVHTGEKPFECPQCGKRFTNKWYMKKHLHAHTEEKPFECLQCGKKFAKEFTLKKHLHAHIIEDCFQCPHCVKKFLFKSILEEHLRVHT